MNVEQINNNTQTRLPDPKYISQSDFIYFKNELLKDLKIIETNILSKVKTANDQYDSKLINMDTKINLCRSKVSELAASISSDKAQNERVNKLFVFKTNTEDKISAHDKRLKEITENFSDSIYNMNKSIQDNINYPGVIGLNSKFPNLHAFVDFVLNSITAINSFKEKMISLDIQNYRTKLDKIMKSYKAQIDTFISSTQNITTETLVIYDNKVNELLKVFEDKIETERNNFQKNLDDFSVKFDELNTSVDSLKSELINKIGINDDENEKKFINLNSKYDKYISDIELINKKIEETNDNIKQICTEYEDRIKEQNHKLSSRINHLFSLLNSNAVSRSGQRSYFENAYKKIDNFKSIESSLPIRETGPVESRLKRYIEGEISINEVMSNRDKRFNKRQNSSYGNRGIDTDRRNKLKVLENDGIPFVNQIKFIKFQNEALKDNQEQVDNKLFMTRKKIDSYIIEKENIILNKVPRKQIIKNLLQGSSEPLPYYLQKNKEEKKNTIIKMLPNQKRTLQVQKNLDLNASFKKRFHNSTSQFFRNKRVKDMNYSNENLDMEDLQELNKRTFSSKNSKSRYNEQNSMRQNSIMGYNTTDILKENNNSKNKSKSKTKDNYNASKKEENKEDNKKEENKKEENKNEEIKEDNKLDDIDDNKIKSNEIYIKDENKEIEFQKKKTKIIQNFNSASKLFDINMKSENLLGSKYKLNPLHKNIKIQKVGSPTNQTFNTKQNKEKTQRPPIHYYLNVKNKN